MTLGFRSVDPARLAEMVGRSVQAAEFLALFGVRVRNHDNVARISAILAEAGVATVPSFTTCAGSAEIHVIKADLPVTGADESEDELPPTVLPHSALQVGDLPCARVGLESVPASADLATATLLMRAKNYSQLPVINGTSELCGVLTWSSIALSLETGRQRTLRSAMVTDSIPVAEVHQQLLAHLPSIVTRGYLLVRANDGQFCGIIT